MSERAPLSFSRPIDETFESVEAGVRWRKSPRSQTSNCVEVAPLGGVVGVRDSKDREGPVLNFDPQAWRGFTAFVASKTVKPQL